MTHGDLVWIVASDEEIIGPGIYLGERWYDALENLASYVYYNEGSGWKFGYFDEPWWHLKVVDDSQ